MHLIFCLASILTELHYQSRFHPVLHIYCRDHRRSETVTDIYQAVRPQSGYHSLVKFLSRGKWDADVVAKHLIKLLQGCFDNWVYVYDRKDIRQAIWTSPSLPQAQQQFTQDISLAHWGCFVARLRRLARLGEPPKTKQDSSNAVLKRICTHIPRGLIIFESIGQSVCLCA